jgi:hypothetical protein
MLVLGHDPLPRLGLPRMRIVQKLLLVLFGAFACGASAAGRDWIFGDRLHNIIRDGLFFFVSFLIIGVLIVRFPRKD